MLQRTALTEVKKFQYARDICCDAEYIITLHSDVISSDLWFFPSHCLVPTQLKMVLVVQFFLLWKTQKKRKEKHVEPRQGEPHRQWKSLMSAPAQFISSVKKKKRSLIPEDLRKACFQSGFFHL